ncbi:MAG: hypothetical protein M3O15_10475, partial [Acidobacteriota bacterium]|nr:hypothetical protein [Acidobacteriota bacterium]
MPPSLAAWLAVAQPHLPDVLADATALQWLRELAGQLPGECLGALEVRLAPETSTVDLAVHLTRAVSARQLAERFPGGPLRQFLISWAAACLAPVPSLWLEFDLDRRPVGLPLPGLCAQLGERVPLSWLGGTLLPSMRGRA